MIKIKSAEEILTEQEQAADKHIHMPSPSYWPLILALGLPITAYGVIYSIPIAVFGGVVILFAAFGLALEPATAKETDFDPPAKTDSQAGEVISVG